MNVKSAIGWVQLALGVFAGAAAGGLIHPNADLLAALLGILGGLSGGHSLISGSADPSGPRL